MSEEEWARAALRRASQLMESLPDGWARMLFRRVVLVQASPDLGVGLCLACAGAEVELLSTTAAEWNDPVDSDRVASLRALLASREPRLDISPLVAIGPENFRCAPRLRLIDAPQNAWGEHLDPGIDTWVIDGVSPLGTDPEACLRTVHRLASTGGVVQIAAAKGEAWDQSACDGLVRAALEVGFGVRWLAQQGQTVGVGLTRLEGPLREFPIEERESPMLLAHCHSRYDIACQLVKGARVLDAGGGTGIGGRRMLAAGAASVVSLDGSADATAAGQALPETPGLQFHRGDLDAVPLPFAPGSFDVVTCIEALEHIRNPEAALAEFERVLRPGGLLFATVPDADFETRSSEVNGFDNPFHPNVPLRAGFEAWLTRFSDVRWLRQVDVVGTWVVEDPHDAGMVGKAVADPAWAAANGPAQVVGVVCVRNGASARLQPEALLSTLRIWQSHHVEWLSLRERVQELEGQVLAQRFRWWTEYNAALADAQAARIEASALRAELARSRAQLDRSGPGPRTNRGC